MKLEHKAIKMNNFQAGSFIKKLTNQAGEYQYFLPNPVFKSYKIENQKIIKMLELASRSLGELKVYGEITPDINFFIKMYVVQESNSSSKIEGTQTNIEDAFLPIDEIKAEKREDWEELNNHINAMSQSILDIKELPISLRLIKKTHKTLLQGVRGKHKMPGEIRSSQNWIGGASINSAHFIPPHQQHLPELLSDWEKFWHYQNELPSLIKIALCHYQFETIHPFLDDNGRVGRLIIILQMIEKQLISHPILYISIFFEKHRQAYYDALDKVRATNNINQWILFFLEAVYETANQSKDTLKKIILLKSDFEKRIDKLASQFTYTKETLNYLFKHPIVTVKTLSKELGLDYQKSNNLIKKFVQIGIVKEITGNARNRIFMMKDYFKLFTSL